MATTKKAATKKPAKKPAKKAKTRKVLVVETYDRRADVYTFVSTTDGYEPVLGERVVTIEVPEES